MKGQVNLEIANNKIRLFSDYPDVVNIKQMCEMLGNISTKTGYELLKKNKIQHFRIGHKYMIPKCCIISYISDQGINILN